MTASAVDSPNSTAHVSLPVAVAVAIVIVIVIAIPRESQRHEGSPSRCSA